MELSAVLDFKGFESEDELMEFISEAFSKHEWKHSQSLKVSILNEKGKDAVENALENLEE